MLQPVGIHNTLTNNAYFNACGRVNSVTRLFEVHQRSQFLPFANYMTLGTKLLNSCLYMQLKAKRNF